MRDPYAEGEEVIWRAGVRKTCLMVLSHLILNDMMKVKGHIARLALCLQDDDQRISGLAHVFFHELSRKAFKVQSSACPCPGHTLGGQYHRTSSAPKN